MGTTTSMSSTFPLLSLLVQPWVRHNLLLYTCSHFRSGVKLLLFLYCLGLRKNSSQVHVLWEDHRNDLFINGFGMSLLLTLSTYPVSKIIFQVCSCLLAPEYPRAFEGGKVWCQADCPVDIYSREYVNCTEKELFASLVDLTFLSKRPYRMSLDFLFDAWPGEIMVTEREATGESMFSRW